DDVREPRLGGERRRVRADAAHAPPDHAARGRADARPGDDPPAPSGTGHPWFDLLIVSPSELAALAEQSGWRVAHVVAGDPPDYYAVLEKAVPSAAPPVSCGA